MASETGETVKNETKVEGSLTLELKPFEKIGRREKGTSAEVYSAWQITDCKASNPAELIQEVLSFLDGNFEHLKGSLINGANERRRFIDAPGADPVEQVLRLMAKKGLSLESFMEKALAK